MDAFQQEVLETILSLRKSGALLHGNLFSSRQVASELNRSKGIASDSPQAYSAASVGFKLTAMGFKRTGRGKNGYRYHLDESIIAHLLALPGSSHEPSANGPNVGKVE